MKRETFTSIRHFILEKLNELGDVAIEAFFPAKYPGTELMRGFLSYRRRRGYSSKKSFSAILSQLRKDKLVIRNGPKKYASWKITPAGKKTLLQYRQQAEHIDNALPPLKKAPEDGILRVVTFDVPEKDRKKRNWLRVCLKELGFRQLHKSVWIGKCPLPEDFIPQLRQRNMLRYIHIVSIQGKGTLEI